MMRNWELLQQFHRQAHCKYTWATKIPLPAVCTPSSSKPKRTRLQYLLKIRGEGGNWKVLFRKHNKKKEKGFYYIAGMKESNL